ncbi:hypothetical protein EAI_13779 [Harpegnathos saltator]|uniref:KIF-binding protein n=1 Tax=Harpegnathos saltator TaxID=610380 RepID=E2BX88_HARSA|nr:hypothetical protein EAI_13779 [Harpegnathos saltator]
MSSKRPASDQKGTFVDSEDVSVMEVDLDPSMKIDEGAKSAENIKNAENIGNVTIDVSENLMDLLRLTTNIMINVIKNENLTKSDALLRQTEANMNKLFQFLHLGSSQNIKPDDSTILAQAYLNISTVYHNLNSKREKIYIAEAYLTRCIKLLKDKKVDRKTIMILISANFELGHIWYKLDNQEKSKKYYYEILQLYTLYTQGKDDYPVPVYIPSIIDINARCYFSNLDTLYWQALHDLSTLFNKANISVIENEIVVTHLHNLLAKYLKRMPSSMGRIKWVKHTIELAKLLLAYDRFVEAKNHIAAAAFAVRQFYDEEFEKIDISTFSEKMNALNNQYIYEYNRINLCWASYGVTLLCASIRRLFTQNNIREDESHETDFRQSESGNDSATQPTKLLFIDLEEELREFTAIDRDTIENCHTLAHCKWKAYESIKLFLKRKAI